MTIDELIYLQNPWLRNANYVLPEKRFSKRDIFGKLLKDIKKTRQVISVTGLRRVGKSTLIKQVISELIENENIPRENILYFSFDQPTVASETKVLEEVINFYIKEVVHENLHNIKDKKYLFFDEIQLIPYWSDIIKRFYDLTESLKFIVTGSASLFIKDKSKESLAGRIFETVLPPLTFSEYQKLSKGKKDIFEFLDFGQFPELLFLADKDKKIEYLKESIVGKVLQNDIVKSYGIRNSLALERLFWSLLPNTGQIIESAHLMSDLSFKKATLFKYLSILEKSLLVNKILNLSGSFRSEKRLLRKLYPASSNLLSLAVEPVNSGIKAETYVTSILKEKYKEVYLFNLRGKEIDFVVPSKKLAIEVKYQENLHVSDYEFLEKFTKEKNYKAIVVSKNYKDLRKDISLVPLSEFDVFLSSKTEP